MMCKILVAEDEPGIRAIISQHLKREGFTVYGAADGQEALDLFYRDNYSLIILDVMMPRIDGFRVCERIRSQSSVPILLLTAKSSEWDELQGFHCGADDYITKPFSPSILITRVKSLLKRAGLLMENELNYRSIRILNREREVYVDGRQVVLTPKEWELLNYMVMNKGLALSREQILASVWGYDYYGDERTVDTHIKCIRQKLGEAGQYIKTVRKYGYKIESDSEPAAGKPAPEVQDAVSSSESPAPDSSEHPSEGAGR